MHTLEKYARASIVARGDAPQVFESSKLHLDLVPLFIERLAKVCKLAPSLLGAMKG